MWGAPGLASGGGSAAAEDEIRGAPPGMTRELSDPETTRSDAKVDRIIAAACFELVTQGPIGPDLPP